MMNAKFYINIYMCVCTLYHLWQVLYLNFLPYRMDVDVTLNERIRLDRRCLEVAHLKYAVLATQKCYPDIAATPIPMHTNIADTLKEFTPQYYDAFQQTYSGKNGASAVVMNLHDSHYIQFEEHKCEYPGCKYVLVIDGNMKNRRDICLVKDAGSISYPGLPGQIKTGCTASPAFKSRFCEKHRVRSCSSPLTRGK